MRRSWIVRPSWRTRNRYPSRRCSRLTMVHPWSLGAPSGSLGVMSAYKGPGAVSVWRGFGSGGSSDRAAGRGSLRGLFCSGAGLVGWRSGVVASLDVGPFPWAVSLSSLVAARVLALRAVDQGSWSSGGGSRAVGASVVAAAGGRLLDRSLPGGDLRPFGSWLRWFRHGARAAPGAASWGVEASTRSWTAWAATGSVLGPTVCPCPVLAARMVDDGCSAGAIPPPKTPRITPGIAAAFGGSPALARARRERRPWCNWPSVPSSWLVSKSLPGSSGRPLAGGSLLMLFLVQGFKSFTCALLLRL